MEIQAKKRVRFISRCTCCNREKIVDTPGTTASHNILIDLGFELKDGVYVAIEQFYCGLKKPE